jgi:hypothetical protein
MNSESHSRSRLKTTRKGYSPFERTLAISKATLVMGGLCLERNSPDLNTQPKSILADV